MYVPDTGYRIQDAGFNALVPDSQPLIPAQYDLDSIEVLGESVDVSLPMINRRNRCAPKRG